MNDVQTIVKVGIADLNVIKAPELIRTAGLGSCVGVVLYDQTNQIAGLSHILLPDSSLAKQENINKYKYADTAIPLLLEKMVGIGARKSLIKAKIAGGAQMFQFSSNSDIMRIGPRNSDAVLEILKKLKVPVIAADIGGSSGRTIEFDPRTSMLKIRKVNKEEIYI
ncbi:chemotaxis protein CheD [Virgibacillus halodenitrificans]|uniref:chemotaxis protein CheD n=1 Tax=Virgibacillus halodenitrificans TaxID=1482 RepID=UPI001369618A|nr:chemotaxis protein CheD [Virgibacillus halodenitrificans]MYL45985.1 chemotaxis protein CheD [Virgibacillus halodenitrificans]MYL56578.1 chemotaxis protein CheD [Virgibacillus halodenitrificans]